jgi:hypothetical protein
LIVRSNSQHVENPQLRLVADRLYHASRWFEGEVRDNRQRDLAHGVSDPEQVIEVLTFLRPELDRMMTGLRRAADVLLAMTASLNNLKMALQPAPTALRSRPHIMVLK